MDASRRVDAVLKWVGLGLVGIAILIGLHHLYIAGVFFEMKDVLHHEWFMALSGSLGQWSTGSSSSENLQLRAGFWAGAAPTPLTPHFDLFLPILKRQA